MDRVLSFDAGKGLVEVEAGIGWPALIDYLVRAAENGKPGRGIRQKQIGADRLTIAGALSANAHGRGLRMRPFVGDIESFVLVDGEAKVHHCSRRENAELFQPVIGGYGLVASSRRSPCGSMPAASHDGPQGAALVYPNETTMGRIA